MGEFRAGPGKFSTLSQILMARHPPKRYPFGMRDRYSLYQL
jgi:hypothetical protein